MASEIRPDSAAEVAEAIAAAAAEKSPLEVVGRGSKRTLGRPLNCAASLELSHLSGITLYEPEELVLRAEAGTPMAEIEAAIDEQGQMLAFEPPDLAPSSASRRQDPRSAACSPATSRDRGASRRAPRATISSGSPPPPAGVSSSPPAAG